MLLSAANKMGLERRRIVWVDLADRRHPVSLFQIRRSAHFHRLWIKLLKSIRGIAGFQIDDSALDWAADAAYSLSSDGSVGLGALLRCISSAESRRWFLDTRNAPSNLSQLIEMLAWSLSFPAVHAVSEGENRGGVLDALDKPSVLWLESTTEHFEPKEYLLVQVLVEAAMEDALRTMAAGPLRWSETMKGLTLLHLYPAMAVSLPLEDWVESHGGVVRHVGVHRLAPESPPAPAILEWAQSSEFLWVAGPTGRMRHGRRQWLSAPELSRISELVRGELWLRSNSSGKAVVTRVRDVTGDPGLASRLRSFAAQRRRPATHGQVAAAMRLLAAAPKRTCTPGSARSKV